MQWQLTHRWQGQKGRNERGLTLLELAVAVLVLSVGTMAALGAADQSRLAIGQAEARLLARIAAQNRVEELHLPGVVLAPEVDMGRQRITLSTHSIATEGGLTQVTVSAQSAAGPGAVAISWLPGGRP